jgi:hypothetical protein
LRINLIDAANQADRIPELEARLSEALDLHDRWMRAISQLSVEFGISAYDDMPGKWYDLVSERLNACRLLDVGRYRRNP